MTTGKARERVLHLPGEGRLLVCTDLHGNLRDFRRMRDHFFAARERHGRAVLLLTGDLVHGPCFTPSEWPDYLGTFYPDQSGELLDEYIELKERFSNDVFALIGNHEHSHVGGPHTPKFWEDETLYFEHSVGPERADVYRELFRSFAVLALTPCGVAITHAAPNAVIDGIADLEQLRYRGHHQMNLAALASMPLLGRLLWSRRCPTDVARHFLAALGTDGAPPLKLVVFGHDIVTEGFERFGREQLLLSTSFGLVDRAKTYLDLDLAGRYESTDDLQPGRELLPLYG